MVATALQRRSLADLAVVHIRRLTPGHDSKRREGLGGLQGRWVDSFRGADVDLKLPVARHRHAN